MTGFATFNNSRENARHAKVNASNAVLTESNIMNLYIFCSEVKI
jgi:hypothetical protein